MSSHKAPGFNYVYYGTACHASELIGFLDHALDSNVKLEAAGRRKTPVCIWGRHGVGKTEIVEQVARQRGWPLVSIAPAQFEEMGDLAGMPVIVDGATRTAPPAWVPRQPGPGILLIDDVNRADDRILRGIMQLLQNFELAAWKLPAQWQIVLTANPDGGDYSVTPMDDAMLTRMLHVTLRFDVKAWAAWAERAGIDPRGIHFVLTYPEIVSGKRTTPRTLVQFFDRLQDLPDLQAALDLVTLLADACLDMETTSAFIAFVRGGLDQIVGPDDILGAASLGPVEKRLAALVEGDGKGGGAKGSRRIDILAAVCTRLSLALQERATLTDRQVANLRQFLTLPLLPDDLRLMLAQELGLVRHKWRTKLFTDPKLALLLLGKPVTLQ